MDKELEMEARLEDIPAVYQQLVEAVGLRSFFKLLEELGGTTQYLPKLEAVLEKPRNRLIAKSFNGHSYKELARKYNLTENWVRQIVNEERSRKNQVQLFQD